MPRKRHYTNRSLIPRPLSGPSVLANPAVAFGGVWLMTLGLFSLGMTKQIVPATLDGLLMIGGNIAAAYVLSIIAMKVQPQKYNPLVELDLQLLGLYVQRLQLIWLIGSVFEIVASGGLPLQWALSGQSLTRDYTHFGVPSLHGIMNALYLQMMCGHLLLWQIGKDKAAQRRFLLFLFWPILMLGRGIFLSVAVQSLAIWLILDVIRVKRALTLAALAAGNVVLFGIVGDLRGKENPFGYLIEDKWVGLFDALPTGFLWVYVYITSGINNIFYNIQTIEPSGTLDKTFFKLVPSFLRELLGIVDRADRLVFADKNLNVSTFYAGTISDFGPAGSFIYGVIVVLIATLVFTYAKGHRVWAMLCYSVLFQVLIFSIFYDMLLLLPTLMQIALALYFIPFQRRHSRRLKHRVSALAPSSVAPDTRQSSAKGSPRPMTTTTSALSDTDMPRVSVAVITYNQADIITQTIDSILSEPRYPNLEIVIADDMSTDNNRDVIKDLQNRYPEIIKLVLNTENLGITGNSNAAFMGCTGELVAVMGGDDQFLPGKITAQAQEFIDDPDLSLSYHAVEIFDEVTGDILAVTDQAASLVKHSVYDIISQGGIAGASSMMARRSACPDYGFDERLPVVSDWKFAIDVAYGGKVKKLDGVYGRYRKSGRGASERTYALLDESLRALELIQEQYPDDKRLKDACNKGAARYISGEVYRSILNAPDRALPLANRVLSHQKTPLYLAVWVAAFAATRLPFLRHAVKVSGAVLTRFLK